MNDRRRNDTFVKKINLLIEEYTKSIRDSDKESLNKYRTLLTKMCSWIDVNDRLPEIGRMYPRVLCTNGKQIEIALFQENRWYVGYFAFDEGSMFSSDISTSRVYVENVTHWMPMPYLPIKE